MNASAKYLLTTSALLVVAGCSRDADRNADVQPTPAADPNPIQAETWIDDVQLRAAGATNAAAQPEGDFRAGEEIELSMTLDELPQDATVTTYWYGPDDRQLAYETKQVDPNQQQLSFTQENTFGWQLGEYRAEIWVGDEKVEEETFEIVG